METVSALLAICAGNSPAPVNSPHKGQWRGALMFSLICARINGWVNNGEAGDLRRHPTHCDVIVMEQKKKFSCMKLLLKMPSGKCRSFCAGFLVKIMIAIELNYDLKYTHLRLNVMTLLAEIIWFGLSVRWPFPNHQGTNTFSSPDNRVRRDLHVQALILLVRGALTRHRRFLVVASQSGFMPTQTTLPPTGIGGRNHAKITTYHCTIFVISNSLGHNLSIDTMIFAWQVLFNL